MEVILAETQSFRLASLYEDVWFYDKTTGERHFAGDHYGDPEFGYISETHGWCLSGGEGVIFRDKVGRLWTAFRVQKRDHDANPIRFENEADALWIENAIREANQPGYVSAINRTENGELEIQLDPLDGLASQWRLNVSEISLRKFQNTRP